MTHGLRRPIALLLVTTALTACPRKEDDDDVRRCRRPTP